MQECCYIRRFPEILVDLQFVFVNLLNFLSKQNLMKTHICALVQKAQTLLVRFCYLCCQSTNTSCYIIVLFTCLIKRSANDTSLSPTPFFSSKISVIRSVCVINDY